MKNKVRAQRILGISALAGLTGTVIMGLWVTPPDAVQGDLARFVYIHPPVAWVGYLAFGVCAMASLAWLWPRTRAQHWDRLAGAAGEVGVVFFALTLVTGSIWGRPAWGVWWTWDARLTTSAILLILFVGYLALRRVPGDPIVRARRSAIAALIAALDVPIVHMSVLWWRTLHQAPTVLGPDLNPTIHGSMAWTLLLGFVSFTLVFGWMLAVRYRIGALEERCEQDGLSIALVERRAEAAMSPVGAAGPTDTLPGRGAGDASGMPSHADNPVGANR
ncbi:MAG: cytochrome c biogenesis protein CcsA [Acidimicrobiales bacterium]